jgi:hypothetical protein
VNLEDIAQDTYSQSQLPIYARIRRRSRRSSDIIEDKISVKGEEKLVVFGYGRERLYTRERAKALAREITCELLTISDGGAEKARRLLFCLRASVLNTLLARHVYRSLDQHPPCLSQISADVHATSCLPVTLEN